jgi:O-antigen/teichoic acid export membrane protein
MALAGRLVRNIASNWVGYAVQVVVAFFLTPYIIHSLGETRYGIWTLIMGITGYYGFLDLGVASGMTQYLTRYLAAKDCDALNRTASTGFVTLTCCGLLVFFVSLFLARNVSVLFQIPQNASKEAVLVIAITGASVAIQFVLMTYSAVFTAVQRFDLANGIGIATRLASAAVIVWFLKLGYGLIGLSLVTAGTNVIDYLIRWRVAIRLVPSMKISMRLATREKLSEISKFGLWNMAITGSVHLISYTDAVVIAAFMPVSALAPFAIAASLRTYFEDIFKRVGYVFFPAATELDAQGNQAGLRKLYLVSSKFMFLGSILCGSIGMFWARDFFRLWLGAAFADPANYPSVATIFYFLLFGSIVSVAQRIGYQVLLGRRQVALLAYLFAAEGVCNLLLSLFLVRRYGLIGVALGTLVPAIVFQGLLQPVFVCRSLQITMSTYWNEVLLRPFLVVLALLPIFFVFLSLRQPDDWVGLLLRAALTCVVTVPLMLLIGLNKTERGSFVVRPTAEALRFLGTLRLTRI